MAQMHQKASWCRGKFLVRCASEALFLPSCCLQSCEEGAVEAPREAAAWDVSSLGLGELMALPGKYCVLGGKSVV